VKHLHAVVNVWSFEMRKSFALPKGSGRYYEKPVRTTASGYDVDDERHDWHGALRNIGAREASCRGAKYGNPLPDIKPSSWGTSVRAVAMDPILSKLKGKARTLMRVISQEARDLLTKGAPPLTGMQQHPNLLHTLKVGKLDDYAFKCPPGMDPNKTTIPGVYLPTLMRSTQGLFGTATNKAGTSERLKYLSKAIPQWAPRFLTSDCFSMSAGVFSNYRQTRTQFLDSEPLDKYDTKYSIDYKAPPPGWECAHCGPPNPHVKPYGRYKRALARAVEPRAVLPMPRGLAAMT